VIFLFLLFSHDITLPLSHSSSPATWDLRRSKKKKKKKFTGSLLFLESFRDELDAGVVVLASGVFRESDGDRFPLDLVLR
jgi:hypothetical protein